jgi:hypothetical protein
LFGIKISLEFCFSVKQLLRDQNNDEENKQPTTTLAAVNELQSLNPPEREMIPLDKYKLEVEQRVRRKKTKYRLLKMKFRFYFRNTLRIFYDIVIVNYNN